MPAKILDGKALADSLSKRFAREASILKKKTGYMPQLVSLCAGDDKAGSVYLKSQKTRAEDIGIKYSILVLNKSASEAAILQTIRGLNSHRDVTAVIIQRPLPKAVDREKVYSILNPLKDAEGISPSNLGRIFFCQHNIIPPTASAVMRLINASGVKLYGKEAVVVGHSEIVGRPVAELLLNDFATVSVCHIATSQKGDIRSYVNRADILVSAVGRPGIIKGAWIKKGAVVIDVGISNVKGKIVGDVEFDKALSRASYISPVPGGVGPLTTVMLMKNTIELFKLQRSRG